MCRKSDRKDNTEDAHYRTKLNDWKQNCAKGFEPFFPRQPVPYVG
ncbi:unnamed protein product [Acanthoscelides obtectus]|uniref:Uncharacterized protein n=1 Tax=Acanthoscelides obtectus TaxID=200917 RepID=A0A9P0K7J5_ACAOB|nr:unnamed protein product [Acanthoscelides obtectus]CAK1651778.1 hypothetical protein AOBTE_LOCUS17447 [Acanthoscelides obtectus]